MSGADGDLVRAFWRRADERVSTATDLWLELEGGRSVAGPELRRILHTMKGEAHMLGLEEAGHLLQSTEDVVEICAATGDTESGGEAVLAAFDALMAMAVADDGAVPFELDGVLEALREAVAHAKANGDVPRPEVESQRPPEPREPEPAARPQPVLDPSALSPLVHEARRLQREHALLMPALREIRRMLRALLAEIDPQLSPEKLAERIVKTLGYGAEIERRMADLSAQWSTSEFALNLALEQIEESVRSAAMVPVGSLRSQIHRAARGAARARDKRVDVVVEGDAYVDATVERTLEPALLHLVRNAVDHGVEPPEERERAGKPPAGRVAVSIQQTESSVHVVVEDDGRGVDRRRLRDRFGDDDEQALLQRIFEHGVTTRDDVDDLSGRGVGLDVVAREVAGLGGDIRVESSPGEGTRFELVLPTMMRADVVVPVRVRRAHLAVPARAVAGVTRAARLVRGEAGIQLAHGPEGRAELLPLYDAAALLDAPEEPKEGDLTVILEHRTGRFAMRVDRYDDPRALSFSRMEELAATSPVVRGVAPLPDGGVVFLLDVDSVYDVLRGRGSARATGSAATSRRRRVPRVLVVEDAPVARELLLGILRSFGLRVADAADGRQGLAAARADPPDLVVTDIEMPFLGGLDMIAKMRADPLLADVPVVVLTTRSDAEVRDRARALGVRGFLSKQKFVEEELRRVIDRCLS